MHSSFCLLRRRTQKLKRKQSNRPQRPKPKQPNSQNLKKKRTTRTINQHLLMIPIRPNQKQ